MGGGRWEVEGRGKRKNVVVGRRSEVKNRSCEIGDGRWEVIGGSRYEAGGRVGGGGRWDVGGGR